MPKCQCIKKGDGKPCTYNAKINSKYCGVHANCAEPVKMVVTPKPQKPKVSIALPAKSRVGEWSKRIFAEAGYEGVLDSSKAYNLSYEAMDVLESYENNPMPGLTIKQLLNLIGNYNLDDGKPIIEAEDVTIVIDVELSAQNPIRQRALFGSRLGDLH